MPTPKNLREFVRDFDNWPESWMGMEKDLEYGKKLLPFMARFINYLISQDLSRKTLKEYIDNVRLLGGTIIKVVSIHGEYKKDPLKKLKEAVEIGGCLPDGYEFMSNSGLASFERMCGKFEEFLKKSSKGRAGNAEKTTKRNLRNMQSHGEQKRNNEASPDLPGGERGKSENHGKAEITGQIISPAG
jgi:hypothetical protein